MTTFHRSGHWRTNAYGTTFWVSGHSVSRDTWWSTYPASASQPLANGNVWSYPSTRWITFTNPNAKCPVCGATVFFYQSPYGGRVYFDELGPPWPKHPCTDSSDRVPSASVAFESRASWARNGWEHLRSLDIRIGPRAVVVSGLNTASRRVSFDINSSDVGYTTPFGYFRFTESNKAVISTLNPLNGEPNSVEASEANTRHRNGRACDRHRLFFPIDYRGISKNLRRRLGLPAFRDLRNDGTPFWEYTSENGITFFYSAYVESGGVQQSAARVAKRAARRLINVCRLAKKHAPGLAIRVIVLSRNHLQPGFEQIIASEALKIRVSLDIGLIIIDTSTANPVSSVLHLKSNRRRET